MEINSILSFENIILISTGLVNLILFIIIGLRNSKSSNTYLFLGFILSVFGWVSGVFLFRILEGRQLLLATQFVYFSATLIPLFIFLFTETFPKRKLGFSKPKLVSFLTFPIIFSTLSFIPGAVIDHVTTVGDYKYIAFGPFYYFYVAYILAYFSIGIGLMVKRFFVLKGIERNQIEIIFVSILVSSFVGVATNLILPSLGNFSLFWVGPFFSGYMVLTISYAIVKYGLFDMKLIAAEFVALSTWVLMFIKIISDKTKLDRTIDSAVLILLVVSGIFIIRAIIKERTLREKDDMLVDNVSHLNKSLEKTNLKLKELDEKKSEFMSLATHQLRAPLTAMRGYSSMIMDGTFGKVGNPEIEDAIDKISRSTTDLTMIVEDYLNISRIEQGRMQYNFSIFDITDTIKNIIKEVQVNIDRAGLTIALHYDQSIAFKVNVDEGKIKQVLFNLIDNASKYTKKGGIDIYVTEAEGDKMRIEIRDTGVGIKPQVLPTLFNKFVRAPDASKANILGTGLGLYVANEIIRAHNGKVWAKSAGEGKGSSFFVELGMVA